MKEDITASLDSAILEAAIQAENVDLRRKLRHAIQINRIDLAREELRAAFAPDSPEKPVSVQTLVCCPKTH